MKKKKNGMKADDKNNSIIAFTLLYNLIEHGVQTTGSALFHVVCEYLQHFPEHVVIDPVTSPPCHRGNIHLLYAQNKIDSSSMKRECMMDKHLNYRYNVFSFNC